MKKMFIATCLWFCSIILKAQTFEQLAKLNATDRSEGNQFGSAVSISGNYAVIGAADISAGQVPNSAQCAYVYERNASGNWAQVQKLVASDKAGGDNFGHSVSISDNYIIVGSPIHSKDANGGNSLNAAGAAYVFERNASGVWVEIKKLVAGDRSAGDNFGYSVSVSGNNFVIGAPNDDDDIQGSNSLPDAGSVYFFSRHIVTGNWFQINKMVAYDRAGGAGFGFSVSISGIHAVVGAPYENKDTTRANSMQSAGAAYIFHRPNDIGGWSPVHKIVYFNRAVADHFGYAVAISGDALIVGSPFEDEDERQEKTILSAGSVHIFERKEDDRWWWVSTLTAPDRAIGDNFGQSVSITKDMVVVGAPTEDENITGGNTMTSSGAAYIFRLSYDSLSSGWRFVQKITAADRTAHDWFGYAVAIHDNNAIIGAPFQDKDSKGISVNDGGGIYVFKPASLKNPLVNPTPQSNSVLKEFVETNKLLPGDRHASDQFGYSVSINGNYAVAGAPTEDDDANGNNPLSDAGSAYIFEKGSDGKWKQVQKIVASDRGAEDNFGYAVGISGNTIVVGAPYEDEDVAGGNTATAAGAAYIFERGANGTWVQVQKIIAYRRDSQIYFGFSVAIDGNRIVIGCPAYARDEAFSPQSNINAAGALFVFEKTAGRWNQTQLVIASDHIVANIGDALGVSVSICGDLIIAGAWGADLDVNGSNRMDAAGAAYIFERAGNRWKQVQKIVAGDRAPFDEFGVSVAISGDNAIIGARRKTETSDPNSKAYTGNAYIFSRRAAVGRTRPDGGIILTPEADGKWRQVLKINPEDRKAEDRLGWSVAMSGDYAIASATGQDSDSLGNFMADGGAIYVYYQDKRGNWSQSGKLATFDRSTFDNFGYAVAINGCNIIGGTIVDQEDAKDGNAMSGAGSAYIFSASGCNNSNPCYIPERGRVPRVDSVKSPVTPPVNINGPKPKTDSVKTITSFFDVRKVEICVDDIANRGSLPPRPATTFPALPKIKPNGELDYNVGTIKQELTGQTDVMWSPGETISVGFLPSSINRSLEIGLIKNYAVEWEGIANIKLQFVDDISKAKIKIAFDDSLSYSWSWLGRWILLNPLGLGTMLYGWRSVPPTNPRNFQSIRANILHEFGHALGFVHEHQSPNAGIMWDPAKVYAFYGAPPLNWSRTTVDDQIFYKYSKKITNSSVYDKFSIMHYYYPDSLTVNKTRFTQNLNFSTIDSAFAKQIYPFPPSRSNATGTLHTTDDCDEIDFTVEYNAPGVDPGVIDFILEPGNTNGKPVTWWKRIGIPSKGGVDIDLDIENGSVSNKKIPVIMIDDSKGISFWKAKLLGIHTKLPYKWEALPAITGGCRVRLTWRQDKCP